MSSRFKPLRAVAACAVSALALSGIAAGSASACSTTEIDGQGSFLQKAAQQKYWIPGSGCKVTYTPSTEAEAFKAFGVGENESPFSSGDEYIGTDYAPTGSFSTGQFKEIEKEAKGTEAKPQDLVIPVVQAAIAVIVTPPAGCTITKITNAHLEEVFRGTLKEWKSIATGETCTGEITRVVRKEWTGATYQFKHYLFDINSGNLKGTKIGSGPERTWEELQPAPTANLEWPEEAGVLSPLVHAKNPGGSGEVAEVGAKSGSIGYAALPDVRAALTK
jgi:ABC-type phosphate transport system substrate-binding protein